VKFEKKSLIRTVKVSVIVSLLLISFWIGFIAASPGFTPPDIYLDGLPSTVSYVVETDGTYYWATRYDGKILFSGTNKQTTVQSTINALTTGGTILLREIRKPNNLTHASDVRIIEHYQGEERVYLSSGLAFSNVATRTDIWGLTYYDSQDGAHTVFMNENVLADQYYSWWTMEQQFGFGTYQWKAKATNCTNPNIMYIFGLEWHHGRGADGIIDFWFNGTHYAADNSYNGVYTFTVLAAQDWTVERTFKINWTSASIKFYIDGALKATHNTNVPQYPMCFFGESFTGGTPPAYESFLKIRNFEEIVA